MSGRVLGSVLALLLSLLATGAAAGVMAWGRPTPAGGSLGVTEARFSCSNDPKVCIAAIRRFDPMVKTVSINIATKHNHSEAAVRAREYVAMAHEYPQLKELALDDFWAFVESLRVRDPEGFLLEIAASIKSKGQGLRFGVTVYEDQLEKFERSPRTTERMRATVDRVAFFLHYRHNVEAYNDRLAKLKRLFPNAHIYAGVYHYDRIDYLPCREGGRDKCSAPEEVELFASALKAQVAAYRAGTVVGLELYPGRLGGEAQLGMWDKQRICRPERKAQCIAVTQQMGRLLAEQMR